MQLSNHKSVKKGFTLIELMIVIAIMGILFTIGFSNFQDYSRQQALLAVIKSTQSDLRSAQGLASAGSIPAGCTGILNSYLFSVSATAYSIKANCADPSGAHVVVTKTVNIPSGYTITSPVPNPLSFKPLGQGTNIPSGTSATITITQASTGNSKVITIGANGNVE